MAPITPIIEASGRRVLRLKVDPVVRDHPVAYLRLQLMLVTIFRVSDISLRNIEVYGCDLEIHNTPSGVQASTVPTDFEWVTVVTLNEALAKLTFQPVVHFQESKQRELSYLVVVDFEIQPFHVWRLRRYLKDDTDLQVMNVEMAGEPTYDRQLLRIFAPGVEAHVLESRIRAFFSRELYDI